MSRDWLDRSEARARLAAQWPIAEKVGARDYVIRTDRHVRGDGGARCDKVLRGPVGAGVTARQLVSVAFGVLRRRDPLFDERVPLVAMRALPEQLGAAVAAAHADVRVEVEDRVAGEVDVAVDERRRQVQLDSVCQIAWWSASACGLS